MVVLTAKVSKGKIIAIVLIVAVIVALLVTLCAKTGGDSDTTAESAASAATNDQRIAYLQALGWEVEADPVETQEVRIPAELPEVLQRYNELQRTQGFDLARYAGETAKRYVYKVLNFPDTTDSYYVTLLVHKDAVIGGDVSAASQNGLMQGLQYPKT